MGRERAQPEKAIASGSVQLEKQAFISKNDLLKKNIQKWYCKMFFVRKELIVCLCSPDEFLRSKRRWKLIKRYREKKNHLPDGKVSQLTTIHASWSLVVCN
jgi:hypothetical protein